MRPLKPDEIRGTWGTLLLPINADDSIDYGRLREEIAFQAKAGVDGIYSNGSAGEFHAQTEEEFDRVSAVLAEECGRHRLPFQIGVCHMSAQIARERLRRSRQLAPGAVQVVLPEWFALTMDEIVAFLRVMVAEAAPVGVVVYNPGHAKRVLAAAEWVEIFRRVPELVGVKVGAGDAGWYAAMAPVLARASVFVPGHTLATGVTLGAAGAYSNVACLSPAGAVRWAGLMRTDPGRALEWERAIQGFIRAHLLPFATEQHYTNCALDKLLAAIGGWANVGTRLRWPYRWIAEAEALRLTEVARRELPAGFFAE
ncbi:MAG: dihydrodipicolinate synthase family protein [Verrucomicrobia bacterium]|nr:dihydrodipicolinate synthase family protein [Verrucomicrobiota bacterium]